MGQTLRLTMAQALVRYLVAQRVDSGAGVEPLFAGVFAIFGHGNVAGLGEALHASREVLPTFRAHNEQGMAHAAIAFAKTHRRRRMMAVTTSIGPGATNLVTAAATAHVNRLPVLLLPGDIFANRRPDPVLQQLEVFGDPTLSVNDCLKPVSRYWDRIMLPEQLLEALPAALAVLTDPAACGPATLALPQDVQTVAFDYPVAFFAERVHSIRRPEPDRDEAAAAARLLGAAQKPLIIAGGGVHYAGACPALAAFAERHGIPVAETQAGKSALGWDHPLAAGALGVTGTAAANALAAEADVVLAVGTRLSDFTSGSRALFAQARLIGLNVAPFDAHKHGAVPVVADALRGLEALEARLGGYAAPRPWSARAGELIRAWWQQADTVLAANPKVMATDAQVLGAISRRATPDDVIVCAAGGLPGEMHKLWRSRAPGDYHVEYGFSCMGYEIAGGLGVKLARPDAEVVVVVGDGSYLMLSSEIATSVMLGKPLTIVVLDNRGYGCINRLQQACGGAPFNNLLQDSAGTAPPVDFAAHATALGVHGRKLASIAELEAALVEARGAARTTVLVIDTDPKVSTALGGTWWDVAVPEVSGRPEVRTARTKYEKHTGKR